MTIKRTNSGLGLPAGFPFSLACEANGICVTSGLPPLDPNGKVAPGTFDEEPAAAWHDVIAIAKEAADSIDETTQVQCVLGEVDYYDDLNNWWRRDFPDLSTTPARFHVPGRRPSARGNDQDSSCGGSWHLSRRTCRHRV